MKRQRLIVLLLIASLLTGCFLARSGAVQISLELQGTLGETQEVMITNQSRTYLIDLGSDTICAFSLASGSWWVQAFSRDAEGRVFSASELVRVSGRAEAFVVLGLIPVQAQTTEIRPHNVVHTWPLAGGMELTWECDFDADGNWEVWRRRGNGVLWQRVKQIASGERAFSDPDHKAYAYIYALRYVQTGVLPSGLEKGEGVQPGLLEVTWSFEHSFAPAPLESFALGLAMDSRDEMAYADLVVHFRSGESFEQRRPLLAALGLRIKGEIPSLLAVLVEPESYSDRSLEKWSTYSDDHLFIEPNWIVVAEAWGQAAELPWYLDYIRIPAAHQVTTGDPNLRIAVVDTGLQQMPAVLPAGVQVIPGYNFSTDQPNPNTHDDHANLHGTRIAQTISQVIPNVTLQPIKVLRSSGSGTDFQVSEGILYAAGLDDTLYNPSPCQIINLSLGQSAESTLMRKRVELVTGATDILLIAASGNNRRGAGPDSIYYPAALPGVMAVGAIQATASLPTRAGYSCYGPELDLVAPPSFTEGTSFATALVSGVAGLVLSQGFDPHSIPSILTTTAMDLGAVGWDHEHGHGLVNAEWAVKNIQTFTLQISQDGEPVIEMEKPLQGASKMLFLPPGEYRAEAWVNLRGGLEPEPGDYVSEPALITVRKHQETKAALILREKTN